MLKSENYKIMNKLISFALLLLLSLASGCRQKSGDGGLPVIDVAGSIGTYRQIPMSELISEVEYIPFETGPDFMIGGSNYDVITTASRIFVRSPRYCYVFTGEGKFISDIGRQGRGPGEYTSASGMSIDETNRTVYLNASDKILKYTWDGEFVSEFEKPMLDYAMINKPQRTAFLRDNLFIGHIFNTSGQVPENWIIFDDTGTVVKTFLQSIKVEKADGFVTTILDSPRPQVVSEEAYVQEYLNDTLFLLNRNDELVPKFVFNLGRYAFPHDVYLTPDNVFDTQNSSIVINNHVDAPMFVIPRKVLFSANIGENIQSACGVPQGFKYTTYIQGNEVAQDDTGTVLGIYDIRNGKTDLLDRDPVTRKWGLMNDLDGGLSFWPTYYNHSKNELVQVLETYEMKELLTEEYFAAHPAKDPEAHARLRALVENLKETDNPVIVVAKLKK